jgi:hypothetical protein
MYLCATNFLNKEMTRSNDQETILNFDDHRARCHNDLARQFQQEGIINTRNIGRCLGKEIAISLGLTLRENGLDDSFERVKIASERNYYQNW